VQIYRSHFGQKLKAARQSAGLTQAKFAEDKRVGVDPTTVWRWEKGEVFPEDFRMPGIYQVLGVNEAYFNPASAPPRKLSAAQKRQLVEADPTSWSHQTVALLLEELAAAPEKLRAVSLALLFQNWDLAAKYKSDLAGLMPKSKAR